MRAVALSALLTFALCHSLHAQSHPPFQLLRSDENYAYLKDSATSDFWEKLKWIQIGRKSALSMGGEARTQFQYLDNEEWQRGNDDVVLFQRLMLHGDWLVGSRLRLFGQWKSGFAPGRNVPVSPLDEDPLDLHQLFAGWQTGRYSTLETGRRELRYGSRRLVDVREGTNVRQSFDGLRWIWQKPGRRLDLFWYAYNQTRRGVFDNRFGLTQSLWGGYFVWNATTTNLDFYYLGARNDTPRFEDSNERERRHSAGLRHWGRSGRWQYNNEAVFQVGAFGKGRIVAWTVSTDLHLVLPGRAKPTLGLKADVVSGDRRRADGRLGTFNPLYPRGGYFGLLALIGPANLFDLHPSATFDMGARCNLSLDWDFFWRYSLQDGIYFPSGRLNVAAGVSRERFVGHQSGLQLSCKASRFFELEASYFYFRPGPFLHDRSEGAPYAQAGISATFKF